MTSTPRTPDLDHLAECIRRGDDPRVVIGVAVAEAVAADRASALSDGLEKVQEVEARLAAATAGPWDIRSSGWDGPFDDTIYSLGARDIVIHGQDEQGGPSWATTADAQLIANAPTDLRELIDLARAQQAELERLRAQLTK
jgi:hypothetical protein